MNRTRQGVTFVDELPAAAEPDPLPLWETETRREPSRALARDDEIRQPGFGSIRARTDVAQSTEAAA